jgi:multidrug efflux pump
MNGSPGLIYIETVSQANGTGTITLSFEPGTNPDLAQVDVQNRLARATTLASVCGPARRTGRQINAGFLLCYFLSSDNPNRPHCFR